MKKVILSVAVAALGFVATSCSKSYDCDCATYGGSGGTTYSTSTIKASNADEATYTCSDKSTAPGSSSTTSTVCGLR